MDANPLTDRATFGAWLRRERERRGLTLVAIANRTKIAASLLAGLEEGDLSRWPTGIFRRAFVRSYAEAIGLDPDRLLAEFVLVHPEGGGGVVTVPRRFTSAGGRAEALRLTLVEASHRPLLEPLRLAGVCLDALVVAVVVGGIAFTLPGSAPGWLSTGAAWLLLVGYLAVGGLVLREMPGLWLVRHVAAARADRAGAETREAWGVADESGQTVVPFPRGRRRHKNREAPDAEQPARSSHDGRARVR